MYIWGCVDIRVWDKGREEIVMDCVKGDDQRSRKEMRRYMQIFKYIEMGIIMFINMGEGEEFSMVYRFLF